MKSLILFICGFGVASSMPVGASESTDAAALASAEVRLEAEMALAPVRSADDLAAYISSHKGVNALDQLQPMRRELFLQSLVFGEKGLLEFNHEALGGLGAAQMYQVLSIFGAQSLVLQGRAGRMGVAGEASLLAEPLKGFRCAGGHTCMEDSTAACTSNC